MEGVLLRERYKIIRIIRQEENYVCAQAVDILDREKPSRLLNMYEGALLREYLPRFHTLEGRDGFYGMFVDNCRLVAVSEDVKGTPIDEIFYKGDRHSRRERLEWADALMQSVLGLADADPAIACAGLLSENVLTEPDEKHIRLRFAIYPLEGTNPREAALLAGDQLKKILRPRWDSPAAELYFWDELDRGEYQSPVKLYSLWARRREDILASYDELDKKNGFARVLSLLWQRLRRGLTKGVRT